METLTASGWTWATCSAQSCWRVGADVCLACSKLAIIHITSRYVQGHHKHLTLYMTFWMENWLRLIMSSTHSQVLISSRPNFGKNTLLEENLVYVRMRCILKKSYKHLRHGLRYSKNISEGPVATQKLCSRMQMLLTVQLATWVSRMGLMHL